MKLSEAILLGIAVLTAKAGRQHFREMDAGCALGMAAIAAGYKFVPCTEPFPENERRTLGAEGVWGDWVLRVVMRTCDCGPLRVPRAMRIKDIIAHLFDYHVMVKKDWTLNQLAAWVQNWEPTEFGSRAIPATILPDEMTSASQAEDKMQAGEHWQVAHRAFAAKRSSPRGRRRSA